MEWEAEGNTLFSWYLGFSAHPPPDRSRSTSFVFQLWHLYRRCLFGEHRAKNGDITNHFITISLFTEFSWIWINNLKLYVQLCNILKLVILINVLKNSLRPDFAIFQGYTFYIKSIIQYFNIRFNSDEVSCLRWELHLSTAKPEKIDCSKLKFISYS